MAHSLLSRNRLRCPLPLFLRKRRLFLSFNSGIRFILSFGPHLYYFTDALVEYFFPLCVGQLILSSLSRSWDNQNIHGSHLPLAEMAPRFSLLYLSPFLFLISSALPGDLSAPLVFPLRTWGLIVLSQRACYAPQIYFFTLSPPSNILQTTDSVSFRFRR